jgi:hypothetical protein
VQATARKLADEQIIIALGVTLDGQKIPLGFVQAATENERKNVESYLPKSEQSRIRRKMEAAYSKPTYEGAKKALDALKLELMNQSALSSLEEGMEETLTLHRLGLMSTLSQSFIGSRVAVTFLVRHVHSDGFDVGNLHRLCLHVSAGSGEDYVVHRTCDGSQHLPFTPGDRLWTSTPSGLRSHSPPTACTSTPVASHPLSTP